MPRRFWWPSSLADQITLLNNFSAKIGSYSTVLGWTPAQLSAANGLCMDMVQAQAYAEASKLTMQSVTQWRDMIFNGEPVGSNAGPCPQFSPGPVEAFTRGGVQQFSKLRDQIISNNAYTSAIGEDLA